MFFGLQYSAAQYGELKRPNPQGAYGILWEIDNDNLPELDFSILSYSWKGQIVEQKYLKSPPSDAKIFLFWVHRDIETDKEMAETIEAIRREINQRPFCVQVFGRYVAGPFVRDQVKYEGMINLKALVVWNSITDFARMCDGKMFGKAYVIEGVLGVAR
jgi:hypothetical protein